MPIKSKAQQRYLFSRAPGAAKDSDSTTDTKNLPERAHPKGTMKNKPVTKAFKPGRKKISSALSSYGEDSQS